MIRMKLKSDKYKKSRGGNSRLLDIACAKCGAHLFFYQKDGTGKLKRMYVDRIFQSDVYSNLQSTSIKDIPNLVCNKCKSLLGIPYIYKKESRFAIRPFIGSISKKIDENN